MELRKTLLEQALGLPIEDREKLAAALFASLDDEDAGGSEMSPEIEAAWMAVAKRRMEEAERDPSILLDGETVFAELRREFSLK